MFVDLFELVAKAGKVTMMLKADRDARLMTVVVVPATESVGDSAALSAPVVLTASPEELDAGFTKVMAGYSLARQSLEDQLEVTKELMDVAKDAAKKQATKAVAKAGAKVVPAASPSHDDDGVDGEGGLSQSEAGIKPAVAGDAGFDLFSGD